MRLVIVTGMSGAGKSTALKMLEDMGFFCADNLPLPLTDKFVQYYSTKIGETARNGAEAGEETGNVQDRTDKIRETTSDGEGKFSLDRNWVALGIDVRSFSQRKEVEKLLKELDDTMVPYQIIYMESSDETLLKRYKESRRAHPLAREGRIEDGIRKEREVLLPMRERAAYTIDTSRLLTRELRSLLDRILLGGQEVRSMVVTVMSFGFKYGIPSDADLVFDVRFLPNPYYVDSLKHCTGKDAAVQEYVMSDGVGEQFEKKWFDMIEFLLPHYLAEGKTQLVIAVGCTGGKHRSVTMAEHLYSHFAADPSCCVRMEHRDIMR